MNTWRTLGAGAALLVGLALAVGGCAPDDDFLYALRFRCDDDGGCATGHVCGPEGVCVKAGSLPETCNGLDDDLDGAVDDDLVAEACELDLGVCAGATKPAALCRGAEGWDACATADYTAHDAAYEEVEASCDGQDNDCDGATDNVGDTPTAVQEGVCEGAVMVCGRDGNDLVPGYESDPLWEATEASCDAQDNDCDGATDEMRRDSVDDCGACAFSCPDTADECVGGVCHDSGASQCGWYLGPTDAVATAEMCELPAGTYTIGDGEDTTEETLEGDLLVDRFEVTNGRYARFLEAQDDTADLLPSCTPAGARDWDRARPAFVERLADHPVVCVTRAQAAAFCAWAGKRLPTPLEWEAAARGGDDRDYPWGDGADDGKANCNDDICHDVYPVGTCLGGGSPTACPDTAPALDDDGDPTLADGASPLGPLHLAGNAAEWVAGPDDAPGAVRGGSFDDDWNALRTWVVRDSVPDVGRITNGFRCVAERPAL